MKLPELKEKLKSKYIVRVVAGVLTIALVGTGIGATAVFAEKNSTAVTAEADSTTDSSKDADDIADKLMDSVSLKDNDADNLGGCFKPFRYRERKGQGKIHTKR